MSAAQYNARNPAVKRLMKEAQELMEPTELYTAQPLDDNLFEWHFTVRGPPDTDFAGGIYHGRIILPTEYPMKPPSIILLTPNGRFELHKKICLSISGYHPESWQPSWSIRTALLAIIGFMPTHGAGAIGSLEYPPEERRKLAKKSTDWLCTECGKVMRDILPPLTAASDAQTAEARELASQIAFKDEKEVAAAKQQKEVEETLKTGEGGAGSTHVEQRIPNDQESPQVRQRRPATPPAPIVEDAAPAVPQLQPASPARPAPVANTTAVHNAVQGGSGSFILIVLLSLMLGALFCRRLFLMNEWRFHSPSEGASGE
uniref:UBC core domain-containing protein n=1 Tax=Plectus sambesii TaxID=2011161 RepID=A0A914VAR1_9BILA